MLSLLAIHEAAEALLECVCRSLDTLPDQVPGLEGCPCRSCVVPGTPEAHCDGACNPDPGQASGQLTVNVTRMFPADRETFPSAAVSTVRDRRNCTPPSTTAVELAIQVWRCVPIGDECPPSCEELSSSAMQLNADKLAVQRGVLCCYADSVDTRRGRRYALGETTALGPSGGCGGFQTIVTVALDDLCGCEDFPEGPA